MRILEILQGSVSNCPFAFYTRTLQNIMAILFLVFPDPNFSDLSQLGLKPLDQLPGSSLLQVLRSVPPTVDNTDLKLLPGARLHLLMTFPPGRLVPGDGNACCPSEVPAPGT